MAVPYKEILIKTDKDGTEHYRVNACPKCGGTGYIRGYEFIDNARCWKCGASGYYPHTFIVKSEERLEKERIKNKKKLIAQADKHNAEFLADHGFNADGVTYVVLGNTFDIKEKIKELGGKFDYITGWKMPQDNSEWNTVVISIDELANKDENGWYGYKDTADIMKILEQKENEFNATHKINEAVSEYVGNIGDKITADVVVKSIYSFETHYSYYGEINYLYKFEDKDGNILAWKTSGCLDKKVGGKLVPIQEGESCTIVGTVKDHKEYKSEKETILTRVKSKN